MKTTTAVALAATMLATGPAYAAKKTKAKGPACVSEATMQEMQFRQLHSELMTAALACGDSHRNVYNAVVAASQQDLARHGSALKRALGRRTDAFVTRSANRAAQTLDCANATAVYAAYEQGVPLDSISTDQRFRDATGYKVCQPKGMRVARKGR